MERDTMIDKILWAMYEYDGPSFIEWLHNHVVVDNYKDDGDNVEYDYVVM